MKHAPANRRHGHSRQRRRKHDGSDKKTKMKAPKGYFCLSASAIEKAADFGTGYEIDYWKRIDVTIYKGENFVKGFEVDETEDAATDRLLEYLGYLSAHNHRVSIRRYPGPVMNPNFRRILEYCHQRCLLWCLKLRDLHSDLLLLLNAGEANPTFQRVEFDFVDACIRGLSEKELKLQREFLQHNTTIKEIYVHLDTLNVAGHILQGIEENRSIQRLDVGYYASEDQQTSMLMKCLMDHPTIRTLAFHSGSCRMITPDFREGFRAFLMSKECKLERLEFDCCAGNSQQVIELVASALYPGHSIKVLDWSLSCCFRQVVEPIEHILDPFCRILKTNPGIQILTRDGFLQAPNLSPLGKRDLATLDLYRLGSCLMRPGGYGIVTPNLWPLILARSERLSRADPARSATAIYNLLRDKGLDCLLNRNERAPPKAWINNVRNRPRRRAKTQQQEPSASAEEKRYVVVRLRKQRRHFEVVCHRQMYEDYICGLRDHSSRTFSDILECQKVFCCVEKAQYASDGLLRRVFDTSHQLEICQQIVEKGRVVTSKPHA